MLVPLLESWEGVRAFIDAGGDVLWAIFAVTAVMWTVILERWWYFFFQHKKEVARVTAQWFGRASLDNWYARQVRRGLIAEVNEKARFGLAAVKTFVAVCPLLGLLGTVVGMLEVFDVMAVAGNSNPRAMAAGVSQATISTMAGMVAALSGLYFSQRLNRRAEKEVNKLRDVLTRERG